MCLTPSLYFGTRRCTYSDVMSVVTTITPLPRFVHDSPAQPSPQSNGKPVKSAWASTSPSPKKQSGEREAERAPVHPSAQYVNAPLEGDSERYRRSCERQAYALHHEKSVFMRVLHDRRRKRFEVENEAALAIQRVHRGHVLRMRFLTIKEKLRVRKRIRVNLVKVTKGTAIITGERERKARVQATQENAAYKIQMYFRRWCARRVLQRERLLRRQELRRNKACVIQRQWRKSLVAAYVRKLLKRQLEEQRQTLARHVRRLFEGYQARQRVRRIRIHRETQASQRIQWFTQVLQAQKTLVLEKRRRQIERRHRAAIAIQRRLRGVLGRALVWQIRIKEDQDIRAACTLFIQRVYRGFKGRQRVRFLRVFLAYRRAWRCATHITRIVRGFLARRAVEVLQMEREVDVLVQTVRGNTSAVIDLLDGYGLVEAPVDMCVVDPDTKNNMLHLAAKHGRMGIMTHVLPKFLEQAPSMVYAVNHKGETPLELAICCRHEKLASFLLTKTADLFLQASPHHVHRRVMHNGRERSLLLDAAHNGMGSIVTKLLVLFPQLFNGKEIDSWSERTILHEVLLIPTVSRPTKSGRASEKDEAVAPALSLLLNKVPVDVNAQDLVGFTPLHLAAMLGYLRSVKLLLEHNSDVSIADGNGRTAWRIALLNGHESCFLAIRRKWLSEATPDQGLAMPDDPNQSMSKALTAAATKGRHSQAPLHPQLAKDLVAACRGGQIERFRFFVNDFQASLSVCDPDPDSHGDLLLMIALAQNQIHFVRFMLEQEDHDMNYVNRLGVSVLDMALQHSRLITLLVRDGHVQPSLPLDQGKDHRTVCHEAVRRGYDLHKWLNGYLVMPRGGYGGRYGGGYGGRYGGGYGRGRWEEAP
ncbi:hypothetical protein Poli38472_011543 [Pythium oligandrum]|uniref:Uncharacterized protein n=1 Tax=Pythium oligandrum TaxID=41045 RepID=A0A8K1FNI1_PYTOL|nr:hypothetical protein Poli38472_011543 [Pythium oligandrum]|eukprot:TMW64663.1 hypothetical protein Poli38472_011543 [Pythium oligandrum]